MSASAMLLSLIVAASIFDVKGQNLVSCASTICPTGKTCRIIERCWGGDCVTGTGCITSEYMPLDRTTYECRYDSPVLRSLDGGTLVEIKCGSSNPLNVCPTGTQCIEPAGVCCTGADKDSGSCPALQKGYFVATGGCKTFCRHDQECPAFQRCCETGVGCKACMDTVAIINCETYPCDPGFHCVMTENNCTSYPCTAMPNCVSDKAGTCPFLEKQSICLDQCSVDTHCPGNQKCCVAGDCHVCVSPATAPTSSGLQPNLPGITTLPSSGGLPVLTGLNGLNNVPGLPGLDSLIGLTPTNTNIPGTPNVMNMGGLIPIDTTSLGATSGLTPPSGTNIMSNFLTMMEQQSGSGSQASRGLVPLTQQMSGGNLNPLSNSLFSMLGQQPATSQARRPLVMENNIQQPQPRQQTGFQCGFLCMMSVGMMAF